MRAFKATEIYWDKDTYRLGRDILISIDHVVKAENFTEICQGSKNPKIIDQIKDIKETIYVVHTITDNGPYPLRVTSSFLDSQFKNSL